MTALFLAAALLAPQSVAPYTVVDLAPGSVASYVVTLVPQGAPGPWVYTASGPVPAPVGAYEQALVVGDRGYNDACLRMGPGGIQVSRWNDPSWDIAEPWRERTTGRWRPAWVRVWRVPPVGASNGEVWNARPALTVRTSRSAVTVVVAGSPTQSLLVVGDDNVVTVDCAPGPQSRLIQDLATVKVVGSGNVLKGRAVGEMCAAFFAGPMNAADGLSLSGGSVGDDVGLLYVAKGSDGFRASGCSLACWGRAYAPVHGAQGVYVDDRTSFVSVVGCTVSGFQRAVFSHGGDFVKVVGLSSPGCSAGAVFAPYYLTPTVAPVGCSSR